MSDETHRFRAGDTVIARSEPLRHWTITTVTSENGQFVCVADLNCTKFRADTGLPLRRFIQRHHVYWLLEPFDPERCQYLRKLLGDPLEEQVV